MSLREPYEKPKQPRGRKVDPKVVQQFVENTTSLIPEPTRYKNFLIWPNTVINQMDYITCAQTSNGYCMSGKSLEECVDITAAEGTGLGSLIKYSDGKTICVPILTSLYPHVNPAHNLRAQGIYPQFNQTTVYTFLDTDMFPHPDNDANAVYAYDIAVMENVETGYTLDSRVVNQALPKYQLWFNDTPRSLRLQLANFDRPEFVPFDKLTHGEEITLYVPGTSMNLIGTVDNTVVASNTINNIVPFELVVIGEKTDKKFMSYDDTYALKYGDSFVVLDAHLYFLYLTNVTLEALVAGRGDSNQDAFFFQFKFRPQVDVYYCKDNTCFRTELIKTKTDGMKATYEGVNVTRRTDCWEKCLISANLLTWLYQDYVPPQRPKPTKPTAPPSIAPAAPATSHSKKLQAGAVTVNVGDSTSSSVHTGEFYNPKRYRTVLIVTGATVLGALLCAYLYHLLTQKTTSRTRKRL